MRPTKLKIGDKVPPFGELIMIGWVGERYYWFKGRRGAVSMMPVAFIDQLIKEGRKLEAP